MAGAPRVAEDGGAAGLLVGLHTPEALTVRQAHQVGGKPEDQEVDPDIRRPPVALKNITQINQEPSQSSGRGEHYLVIYLYLLEKLIVILCSTRSKQFFLLH